MSMNNKIKAAFEPVRATDNLKEKTKNAVVQKMRRKTGKAPAIRRAVAAVLAAVALLFGVGGYMSYFSTTALVSIGVNPSIELQINRYNRVISADSFNQDGADLLEQVNIQNMPYTDAVKAILNCDAMSDYVKKGDLEIAVVSSSTQKSQGMQQKIISDTGVAEGCVYCTDQWKDVDEAHQLGLSFGKYRLYLQLQQYVKDITPQQVNSMTMRQLKDWLADQTGQNAQGGTGQGSGNQYGKLDKEDQGNQHGKK